MPKISTAPVRRRRAITSEVIIPIFPEEVKPTMLTQHQTTPLHPAVSGEAQPLIDFVLSHLEDVDFDAASGCMPLHIAAQEGLTDLVELLLLSGADVNAPRSDGATPLQLAMDEGNRNVAHLLRLHGGRLPPSR